MSDMTIINSVTISETAQNKPINTAPSSEMINQLSDVTNSTENPSSSFPLDCPSSKMKSVLSNVLTLGCPNTPIFQLGFQAHAFGNHFKGTSTVVVTEENTTVYPLHLEYGHGTGNFAISDKKFGSYALAVQQVGVRANYKGAGWNPLKWDYSTIIEKLEHIEITFRCKDLSFFGFKGSGQVLFALEYGKTVEVKNWGADCWSEVTSEMLCQWPTAIADKVGQLFNRFRNQHNKPASTSNQDNIYSPADSRIKESLSSKKKSATDVNSNCEVLSHSTASETSEEKSNFIVNNLSKLLVRLLEDSNHPESKGGPHWICLAFSPLDINTAITLLGNELVGVDFQGNLYPRYNASIGYNNGKFIYSPHLNILINFFTHSINTSKKNHGLIDDIINQAKSSICQTTLNKEQQEQAEIQLTELASHLKEDAIALALNNIYLKKNTADTMAENHPADAPRDTSEARLPRATSAIKIDIPDEIMENTLTQENNDDVFPLDVRPRSKSLVRRRARSELELLKSKETMSGSAENLSHLNNHPTTKIIRSSLNMPKDKGHLTSGADDASRPRSSSQVARRLRTASSEHSD